VIDTATNTVVATVPVGVNPYGVAIAPDGKRAYVANANSNTVSVIDTATNTVVATVLPGTGPIGVAITPDGKYAYVTNINSGDGSVIDTTSNTVVATIGLGGAPEGVTQMGSPSLRTANTPMSRISVVVSPAQFR